MKIFNKKKFITLLLIVLMQLIFIPIPKAYAYSNPSTVPLGTVSNFAALAHTTTTSEIGGTVLNNGDLGVDADCTGFPSPCVSPGTGTINNGEIHQADEVVTTGQLNATTAVADMGGRAPDLIIAGGLLGGKTLTEGVYYVPAATTNLIGDLTLSGDANSVFIFQMESSLITATASRVVLTGEVQACNVFWKVASSATFNDTTQFVGTILAQASVSFPGGGATLDGRAIAQTGAITFNKTTVNNSSCATPTATPTPTSALTPIPTPTTSPDSTPTPTPTSTPTSSPTSSSSSSSSSSPFAPVCVDTAPANSPDLFQIDRAGSKATLYFTPVNDRLSYYYIAYGLSPGDERYGVSFSAGLSSGVVSYTINDLNPDTTYYFKVRGGNGCAPGGWSNNKESNSKNPMLPNTGNGPRESTIPWQIPVGFY